MSSAFAVPCSGTVHTVTVAGRRVRWNDHDLAAEQASRAFGWEGEVPSCTEASQRLRDWRRTGTYSDLVGLVEMTATMDPEVYSWVDFGMTSFAEQREWAAAGFTSAMCPQWVKSGMGVAIAAEWLHANLPMMQPRHEATIWWKRGYTIDEAAQWSGRFAMGCADEWRAEGWTGDDAVEWWDATRDPVVARTWRDAGWEPAVARPLIRMMAKPDTEWVLIPAENGALPFTRVGWVPAAPHVTAHPADDILDGAPNVKMLRAAVRAHVDASPRNACWWRAQVRRAAETLRGERPPTGPVAEWIASVS